MNRDENEKPWDEDSEFTESPVNRYYSTGGCYRPPRHPRNYGWLVAIAAMALLLIVGTAMAREYMVHELSYSSDDSKSTEEAMAKSPIAAENQTVPADQDDAAQTANDPAPADTDASPAQDTTIQKNSSASGSQDESLTIQKTGSEALTLQEIYKKVIPSVVSISAEQSGSTATGTGIIMSEDGYIITNYHVVSSADAATVLTNSGNEYDAKIIGGDEISDLMVLKIEASGLEAAEFGDSDSVEVGDSVVAIGDPLGIELRGTMTDGIICGISRDIEVEGRVMTLMQTNAALNSGNSGGPLVNMQGQVIGINTMKLSGFSSSSTTVEGIGFAIPITTAKPLIDELIQQGYVAGRPDAGFTLKTVDSRVTYFYGLPGSLCVWDVDQNSDAAAKGIQQGDIIISIAGETVSTVDEFNEIKNSYAAGDQVELKVYRNATRTIEDITITLMDAAEASN